MTFRKLKRGFTVALGGLVALLTVGAGSQLVFDAVNEGSYPAPGEMVAVDGRQMHIECRGEGSPTVILEAGGGQFGVQWEWISRELESTTRVCAYDRAGWGWSEASSETRDAEHVIADLHALIKSAEIELPLVLAGHSAGGLFALGYAQRHPEEVAGLVLIDARHPATLDRSPQPQAERDALASLVTTSRALAYVGAMRALIPLTGQFDGLPSEVRESAIAHTASTRHWHTYADEAAAIEAAGDQVDVGAGDLGAIATRVVTAGDITGAEPWQVAAHANAQADLAAMSTNSQQLIVEDATHVGLLFDERHARAVALQISEVVQEARAGEATYRDTP